MRLLRLFLALSVIAGHAGTSIFRFHGIGAWYAVNFFFIISGFYMTMILNEKYKDTKPIYFYKSRVLRLFPVYYVGLIAALIISFGTISEFFGQLTWGSKVFYVFQNLFIFGQDLSYLLCAPNTSSECANPVSLTINPPAWSLAVELGFYLIAPFILKNVKATFGFVLIGCVYLLSINHIHFPLKNIDYIRPTDITAFNYYFYPSSFIFFGGGALAYHLSKAKTSPHYLATIITILLLAFAQTIMPFWHLLFICLAIPVLFSYTANNRIDRLIGEMSFPAYILHFPILNIFWPIASNHPAYFKFLSLGSLVAITSCGTGLFLYLTLEKWVNKYRESDAFFGKQTVVKESASHRFPAAALSLYLLFPILIVAYVYSASAQNAYDNTPYNLTDSNWIKGIGQNFSGFFVQNTPENAKHYQVGMQVKFANGDIREIVSEEKSAQFLNVYVKGAPLNGEQVGAPHTLEVIK